MNRLEEKRRRFYSNEAVNLIFYLEHQTLPHHVDNWWEVIHGMGRNYDLYRKKKLELDESPDKEK